MSIAPTPPRPAPAAAIRKSGDTVIIGCKLPMALIIEVDGVRQTINGMNSKRTIGGYGITRNVDRSFWETWLSTHMDYEPVAKRLIFAHGKQDHAQGIAREQAELRHGAEPINPFKLKEDPRLGRQVTKDIKADFDEMRQNGTKFGPVGDDEDDED